MNGRSLRVFALVIASVFIVALFLQITLRRATKMDPGGVFMSSSFNVQVPRPAKTKSKSNETKLIILGYKHGGSSFTGSVIDSHPQVFYLYEPVWYVEDPDEVGISISDQRFSLRERVKKQWQNMEDVPEPLDFVKSFLACKSITLIPRLSPYWYYSGRELREMRECLLRKQQKGGKTDDYRCSEKAKQSCLRAKVKAIKTVRMTIQEAGQLLSEDEAIKVLYVVRDPRGNMNSRRHGIWFSRNESKELQLISLGHFIMQCQIMMEDARALLQISQLYGDRILTIRYEDLAEDPLTMASQIFKFLDLNMIPEAKESLQKLLTVNEDKNVPQKVKRQDSFATAIKWRKQIPFPMTKKIEEHCGFYLEMMGYSIFQTEKELTDLKIPLRKKVTVPTLLTP